jgi:hypothetical protein
MSDLRPLECGTCGDASLIIQGNTRGDGFEIQCGNGHFWVVVPGEVTRIVVEPQP